MDAILFDLDDTLLDNDMDDFLPAYFGALCRFAAARYDPALVAKGLTEGARAMALDTDPARTNREVFVDVFSEILGADAAEALPFFDVFYRTQLDTLQSVTAKRPAARELVSYCFARELQVVIATNPVFPLLLQQARLRWAGVGVDEFDYALVTTYEDMHATKPNPAYYTEVLARVGVPANAALMVGDDWEQDIVPARRVGLAAYWVGQGDPPDSGVTLAGHGSLDELWEGVQGGFLDRL